MASVIAADYAISRPACQAERVGRRAPGPPPIRGLTPSVRIALTALEKAVDRPIRGLRQCTDRGKSSSVFWGAKAVGRSLQPGGTPAHRSESWTGSEQLLRDGSNVSTTTPILSNRSALLALPWFGPLACGPGSFRVQCRSVQLGSPAAREHPGAASLRIGARRRYSDDPFSRSPARPHVCSPHT